MKQRKPNGMKIAEKQAVEVKAFSEDFHQFARNDSEFPGVSEFLGEFSKGKRVLEIGCGVGRVAVLLAKSGAEVTAFDLSPS